MDKFSALRIFRNKFFKIFILNNQISPIRWFISVNHFRYMTQRTISAFYQYIGSVNKIIIYVFGLGYTTIIKNEFSFPLKFCKPDNNAIHMCFNLRFAIPYKRFMCKIDKIAFHKWPESRNSFSLHNGIGRNKSHFNGRIFNIIRSFLIPPAYVIQIFHFRKDFLHICFLVCGHVRESYERWISHYVRKAPPVVLYLPNSFAERFPRE